MSESKRKYLTLVKNTYPELNTKQMTKTQLRNLFIHFTYPNESTIGKVHAAIGSCIEISGAGSASISS